MQFYQCIERVKYTLTHAHKKKNVRGIIALTLNVCQKGKELKNEASSKLLTASFFEDCLLLPTFCDGYSCTSPKSLSVSDWM